MQLTPHYTVLTRSYTVSNARPQALAPDESAHHGLSMASAKGRFLHSCKSLSVQRVLELLHGKTLHSLRGGLGLEDARLFGEGVDTFARFRCRLHLQLHLQHSCKFEGAHLFDLFGSNTHVRSDDSLHIFSLQTLLLSHRLVNSGRCHSLFGTLHRLHGLWWEHGQKR